VSAAAFDHNKVLKRVAGEVLTPLGLTQKGRSRLWLDDRRWHVIVASFDPSSFSKGTYLEVHVMWLWIVKDHVSYDIGERVGQFEDAGEANWEGRVRRLAERAAERIDELRREVADLPAAVDILERRVGVAWPRIHAAIANGLAGRTDRARELLDAELAARWAGQPNGRNVGLPQLRELLVDEAAFRDEVVDRIQETRRLQSLPDLTNTELEDAISARAPRGLATKLAGLLGSQ